MQQRSLSKHQCNHSVLHQWLFRSHSMSRGICRVCCSFKLIISHSGRSFLFIRRSFYRMFRSLFLFSPWNRKMWHRIEPNYPTRYQSMILSRFPSNRGFPTTQWLSQRQCAHHPISPHSILLREPTANLWLLFPIWNLCRLSPSWRFRW